MLTIAKWLDSIGLGQYSDQFQANAMDLEVLSDLTDEHLKELGIPLGHRLRLARAIAMFGQEEAAQTAAAAPSVASEFAREEAERRQLTVLFCDLVGSTELSGRLDPEDLRDVMRRYQDAVAGAVSRYGGYLAKFLGDGVLAYFGWPQAYEDQAERAVRAALDAVAAVAELTVGEDGDRLRARAGIATGQVVIGDLVGKSGRDAQAVSGDTPNLAARLQDVAEPGNAVISDATRRLVGSMFVLQELGDLPLKGFAEPVPGWRVVAAHAAESRFAATRSSDLTEFVGREHEQGLLRDRWQRARSGEGQIVLLTGEPGIGKSRLVQAFESQIADEPYVRLLYQCSSYHANSALYPVARQLEFAAGFAAGDSNDARLDKLEAVLVQNDKRDNATLALFADLLSLHHEDRFGKTDLAPQQRKERLLTFLIEELCRLAERQPVLVLFEDAHWIDPTTLELVQRTIPYIPEASILMVITHRPEWWPLFANDALVSTVSLNRLGRDQVQEIVRIVAGVPVNDALLDQVVARSDGIPLFAEELTRSIMEGGAAAPGLQVPESLQSSLLARFDRLGEAKHIGQIAAVLGRDFNHKLLVAVADRPESEVAGGIAKLVDSGVMRRIGAPPEATYAFKHSLAQDAAYESLLRSERRAIHGRVARCLVERFQEVARSEPEVVAQHFEAAGNTDLAIAHWHAAAILAAGTSANREAAAHCGRALALIADAPVGTERDQLELDLLVLAGPQQMLSTGLVTREAEEIYRRAVALSLSTGTTELRFQAQWGLWHVNEFRAEWEPAMQMADSLGKLAEQSDDNSLQLQAHHAKWSTQTFVGEIASALDHAERGLKIYDWERHRNHAQLYGGHDPGVCGLQMTTVIQSIMGQPGRSLQTAHQGLDLADRLELPASRSMMHFFSGVALAIVGEVEDAARHAETAVEVAELHGILPYAQMGRILRGWAQVQSGETGGGLAELEALLESARQKQRKRGLLPAYLGFMADAYRTAGRIEAGISAASDGIARAAMQGEFLWESELLRLLGVLKLARSRDHRDEASTHFREAITKARTSGSHLFALKAAVNLAELLAELNQRSEAVQILDDALVPIEANAATPVMTQAQELRRQIA